MKAIMPGHMYELQSLKGAPPEMIQFHHAEKVWPIQKEPVVDGVALEGEPRETLYAGTTNEEVLAVLIHRLKYLNTKQPGKENSCAITHLQEALFWLNERENNLMAKQTHGDFPFGVDPGAPANK